MGSDTKKVQSQFRELGEDYLYKGSRRFAQILRQLVRYVNRTPDAVAWGLLRDIRTFLSQRFEYEDRLMCAAEDPAFPAHHQQHELMLKQLDWSFGMVRRVNRVDRDLCDFLRDWFDFHIEHLDRPLCEQGACCS